MKRYLLLVGALFLLSHCSRTADLIYYQKEANPPVYSVEHKLKELQGDNKVDILWVIDNSGSMGDDHDNLIKNMDHFLDEFSKSRLEWKMGLISTSYYDKPYVGLTPSSPLNFQTPDGINVFRRAVASLGTSGSGTEMIFDPIVKTLTEYPDFARPNAMLAIIIVTDAHDQSEQHPDAKDVLDKLTTVKGSLRRALGYGVLGPMDFGCTDNAGEEEWNYAGSTYEPFFQALHGKTYPLCSPDFGKNLAEMGKDLVKQIQHARIYLPERPIPKSIKVTCKGEEVLGGQESEGGHWVYDFELNAVVFSDTNFAPGDDEFVRVEYSPAPKS